MTHYQVVLTVGSTRFTPLVHAFLAEQSLEAIAALGVRTVLAQVGSSDLPSGWHQGKNEERYGLQVQVVRYMPELEEHVGTAELVVSHAGKFRHCASISRLHTKNNALTIVTPPRHLVQALVPSCHSSVPRLTRRLDPHGTSYSCQTRP